MSEALPLARGYFDFGGKPLDILLCTYFQLNSKTLIPGPEENSFVLPRFSMLFTRLRLKKHRDSR